MKHVTRVLPLLLGAAGSACASVPSRLDDGGGGGGLATIYLTSPAETDETQMRMVHATTAECAERGRALQCRFRQLRVTANMSDGRCTAGWSEWDLVLQPDKGGASWSATTPPQGGCAVMRTRKMERLQDGLGWRYTQVSRSGPGAMAECRPGGVEMDLRSYPGPFAFPPQITKCLTVTGVAP